MALDALADGWQLWNEEPQKLVFTYRPDLFNTEDYPAPCLPTIHITKGKRGRRPGRKDPAPDASWYVTLYLEPDVTDKERSFDSREGAITAGIDIAEQFATGEIDYRSLYQVPRPAYLDRLDELTGRTS